MTLEQLCETTGYAKVTITHHFKRTQERLKKQGFHLEKIGKNYILVRVDNG